jgi:thioesterase domain-containing protein
MTPTELRLAEVWRDVLGVAEVGPEDNFFDLGGYSLLTLTLLRRIEVRFERTLSIADLFGCADLRAMGRLLDQAQTETLPPATRAIPLQPLGAQPPLVWFDVGPQLRRLATALAPDQPFIGLNLEPHEERELAAGRVTGDAVARRLVQALRAEQPRGPYRLGGWCRWGVMAYAAASQLMAQGEAVELLVLLDAVNMTSSYQTLRRVKDAAWRGVRSLTSQGGNTPPPGPEEVFNFGDLVLEASKRYRPPPYRGAVLLLRACDAEADWDGASGWRDCVKGPLSVVDLEGDHAGILTPPYVEDLGRALKAGLQQASSSA